MAAGGQRYAAHWTGDNVSSWEHYRMNFPMVINMGLSGYAIAGAHANSVACQICFQHRCSQCHIPAILHAGMRQHILGHDYAVTSHRPNVIVSSFM